MGLFSRKSVAKKETAQEMNGSKTTEEQRQKLPVKFVPRHGREGSAAIALANQQWKENSSTYDDTLSFKNGTSNHGPKLHRSSNDYFASSSADGKQPMSAGYYTPHNNSSDSGYESAEPTSAMHSRVPSEYNLPDIPRSYISHNGTMPELRMDGHSFEQELEASANRKSIGNVSPLDLNSDARSLKSDKSAGKRARFEDDVQALPPLDQLEQHQQGGGQAFQSSPSLGAQQEHAPTSSVRAQQEPSVQLEQPMPPTMHSPSTERQSLQQSQPTRSGSITPLSILEGFKVNKKGKILDEQGDTIGELVEGDLLDCVRQKANANGEVIDEYGRVVGRVGTCAPSLGPPGLIYQQSLPDMGRTTTHESEASSANAQPRPVMQQPFTAQAVKVPASAQATQVIVTSHESSPTEHISHITAEHVNIQLAPTSQVALPVYDSKRMSRSASEKSLSELSKAYARPPMSSVPENNVPDDDAIPASPGLFAYKGQIPVTDGPPQSNRRSKSPPHQVQLVFPTQIAPGQAPGPAHYAKLALVGGGASHPNSTLFPPMRSVGTGSRRSATPSSGSSTPVQRLHPALKRSTLNGFGLDATPNGSDAGSDPSSSDDGRMFMIGHTRTGSVGTTATVSKPRTYFTHTGKVTVASDVPSATTAAPAAPKATSVPKVVEKKKSRMSMSFGRKSKVAA